MGSPETEKGRDSNETQHKVTLTKGFFLGETPVTQAQWKAVMGNNPSRFKGDDRPVEQVSWDDAQTFIQQLNGLVEGTGSFRLPMEAEWEYACRAGTETPFWFGENINTDQVNYGEHQSQTVPVKELPANGWGLYQMHGNVWEWCADWYGGYTAGPVADPKGPKAGVNHVLRGGGWFNKGRNARSAYRDYYNLGKHSRDTGFRLARGLI